MKELSLHILDIVQNSITAQATLIEIIIDENIHQDFLSIEIIDNGVGMDKELVEKVFNPFVTTRTTRRVGLGLSLLKASAEGCGGYAKLMSEKGVGTTLKTMFKHSHIDRPPLGNMPQTIITIIMGKPDIDYIYKHTYNGKEFRFYTKEVKDVLDGVPIETNSVLQWIKDYIIEGLNSISKDKVE
jgi:hypothetical protein